MLLSLGACIMLLLTGHREPAETCTSSPTRKAKLRQHDRLYRVMTGEIYLLGSSWSIDHAQQIVQGHDR